jgi:hypothetical protein
MRMCFNILAHEAPDVLTHQIQNIARYNPDALIVVHLDEKLGPYPVPRIDGAELVINPMRYSLAWCHSLVHAWLSNAHVVTGMEWDMMELHTSNNLFVKSGRNLFTANGSDYVADVKPLTSVESHWPVIQCLRNDVRWNRWLTGLSDPMVSYVSGEAFTRPLMMEVASLYDRYFGDGAYACAFEEVFFVTACQKAGAKMATHGTLFYPPSGVVSVDDVQAVISGGTAVTTFWPEPTIISLADKFSVRRVARSSTDPVRQYIMGLPVV